MHRVNVKHGIRTRGSNVWVIASVAILITAVSSGSCFFGSATNLCESGRRCNPGETCAANQDTCIEIGGCGDGIVSLDKDEICDDGNVIDGDGCNASCTSDESCGNGMEDTGETCDDGNRVSGDGCTANCIQESCGDGVYNPLDGEECDTGITDTKACNGQGHCTIPRCGDGYANMAFKPFMATVPEECDENEQGSDTETCNGNNNGFEGPGSCRFALCGDGYLNLMSKPQGSLVTEKCDTGGDSETCNGDNDGTAMEPNNKNSKCQEAKCGDNYVNPMFKPDPNVAVGEACDRGIADTGTCNGISAGAASCQRALCGDSHLNTMAGEACDFGPDDSATCNGTTPSTASCQVAMCGDSHPNMMAGEACDGGTADTATCNGASAGTASCQPVVCGDSHPNMMAGEACDRGIADTDTCNGTSADAASCQLAVCGDGYVNAMFKPDGITGEECEIDGHCAMGELCIDCHCEQIAAPVYSIPHQ